MLSRLRSRLTYANVMSSIAVFGLLGGSAYAANEWTGENIVDGSIKTADVANNNLTGADILDNALRGQEIKDGYLTGADVGDNTLDGVDVKDNSLKGADINDETLDGVIGLQLATRVSDRSSDSPRIAEAECPPGKQVVGTGFGVDGTTGADPDELADVVVTQVIPGRDAVVVQAVEEEPTGDDWVVLATAICAKAPLVE